MACTRLSTVWVWHIAGTGCDAAIVGRIRASPQRPLRWKTRPMCQAVNLYDINPMTDKIFQVEPKADLMRIYRVSNLGYYLEKDTESGDRKVPF